MDIELGRSCKKQQAEEQRQDRLAKRFLKTSKLTNYLMTLHLDYLRLFNINKINEEETLVVNTKFRECKPMFRPW